MAAVRVTIEEAHARALAAYWLKIYASFTAVRRRSTACLSPFPAGVFLVFSVPMALGKHIKMLMGLAPPTSGRIELLGLPMPERAIEIKQQIGLVPDVALSSRPSHRRGIHRVLL